MTVCSQHSQCTSTILKYGERLASIETRLSKVEEVQEDMVSQLKDAAEGLRALAGKIDQVVTVANSQHCEVPSVPEDERPRPLSGSLNHAWRHFQDNFALFIIYASAGLIGWALMKIVLFKEIPPFILNALK